MRVQIMAAAVVVLGAVGGWLWSYSAQSAMVNDTAKRVTTLEQRLDAAGADDRDVIARLARIEGKIEVMLGRVGGK